MVVDWRNISTPNICWKKLWEQYLRWWGVAGSLWILVQMFRVELLRRGDLAEVDSNRPPTLTSRVRVEVSELHLPPRYPCRRAVS
jgi:hypothetical protein